MSQAEQTAAETASSEQAAARNSSAIVLGRLLVAAMGWGGSVLIARALSPQDWGQFSFVFGLLGLLAIITDLGVGRVVLGRLLDSDEAEVSRLASSFIALRATLGLLGYVAAVAYVALMGYPSTVLRATAVAGLVVVVATPSHALTVLYQSRLRLTLVAVGEVCAQAVQLALTVVAALFAPVLLVFVLPALANELVALAWKVLGLRRGNAGPRPTRTISLRLWRSMLTEAVPLTVGAAMVTMLSKLDVLMLSRLDTFDSVGLYSVGYKFSDVLIVVALAVVLPINTLLVQSWPDAPKIFRRQVRQATITLGLLATVAVVAFWAAATPILTLLYGDRFAVAASAARLLVAGGGLAMLTQLGFIVLVSANRSRVYPWLGLAALSLNIGLNLVLIPHMSYNGAAVATIITESVLVVMVWVMIGRTIPVRGLMPLREIVGLALLGAAMIALSTVVLRWVPWPLVTLGCVLVVPLASHRLRLTREVPLRDFLPRGRKT